MKREYLFTAMLVMLVINSCNEDQLDQQNPNTILEENYYQDEAQLTAAVNGAYAILQSVTLAGREYFFLHDLRSDEMAAGGGQLEIHRGEVLTGNLRATNAVVTEVWRGLYRLIHRTNAIIANGVEAEEITDEELRDRRIAEARFLRAWAYFELVTLWGSVPLYTEPVTELSGTQPKAPEEDIYTLIINDLTAAQEDLLYIADLPETELGRVTKEAAMLELARVYMFMGDYQSAITELEEIIASPSQLQLADDYFSNFTEEGEFNVESIWEVGFSTIGEFNWEASANDDPSGLDEGSVRSQEYSAVGWRNLIPSAQLLDEYERPFKGDAMVDPRLTMNFYFIGDTYANGSEVLLEENVQGNTVNFNGTDQKVSWRKYSIMYKTDPGGFMITGINHRMMRYAEVLLNMAESLNETGASETEVLNYLNETRERVGMPPYPTPRYPTATQQERRVAIHHERMVEFAGEQIRNRDILRWRMQGLLTEEPISYFEPRFALLPIPQVEIDNNDQLDQSDQNPGF